MLIRNLTIRTRLPLHPDFVEAPLSFAGQQGVDLVFDVEPATDYRKESSQLHNRERVERDRSNIHLVRPGAIRLFAKSYDDRSIVWSIELNPAMLLHGVERGRLSTGDLARSLEILRNKISPLLADPLDVRNIVPGLVVDDSSLAYWNKVDSEILLPEVRIPSLHDLSHPSTGPAEGTTEKRVQLGDKEDDCLIRFKKARWESDGPAGTQTVEGVRVRLILEGPKLITGFRPFGKIARIGDEDRLVAFSESSIARVHRETMSLLEGVCLPIPLEWSDKSQGKSVTLARTIALMTQLVSLPASELCVWDEEIRHPSKSTRKRRDKDLQTEMKRFNPVPVSSLFDSSVYDSQWLGGTNEPDQETYPLIAEVYGGIQPGQP